MVVVVWLDHFLVPGALVIFRWCRLSLRGSLDSVALPGEKVALSVLLLVAARGGSTVGSASISDFDPFTVYIYIYGTPLQSLPFSSGTHTYIHVSLPRLILLEAFLLHLAGGPLH